MLDEPDREIYCKWRATLELTFYRKWHLNWSF
jgi:hypothetical protein